MRTIKVKLLIAIEYKNEMRPFLTTRAFKVAPGVSGKAIKEGAMRLAQNTALEYSQGQVTIQGMTEEIRLDLPEQQSFMYQE